MYACIYIPYYQSSNMTRCIIELKQYDVMPPHLLYFNLPDKSLPRLMTKSKSLVGVNYRGNKN